MGDKENEISALKSLLQAHLIKGRIFTVDAMHIQRELCAWLHRHPGDHILLTKDNQPTLRDEIADLHEGSCPARRRGPQAKINERVGRH